MGGFNLRCLEVWLNIYGEVGECGFGSPWTQDAIESIFTWDAIQYSFATVVGVLVVTTVLYRFLASVYKWWRWS